MLICVTTMFGKFIAPEGYMSERDLVMNKQVNRHGVKQKFDKDWL